ncbi:hypothetical protein JD969_17900 [Planctomycetota bacterium]|nr:hypothetical protein JD969_17900 [Planctomycetota bacterium]
MQRQAVQSSRRKSQCRQKRAHGLTHPHTHTLTFKHLRNTETANKSDYFLNDLLGIIESELGKQQIEVVRPKPGDTVDLKIMNIVGRIKCPFWRTPERIANICKYGFDLKSESATHVIQHAEIFIYYRD